MTECAGQTDRAKVWRRLVWQLRQDADADVPLREDASVDAACVVAILDLKLLAGRHGRLHAQW